MSTYLPWGPLCLLAEGSHGINGAEIQLLQLTLIKSQSNAPQGNNMVLSPGRRHVPNLQVKKKSQIRLTPTDCGFPHSSVGKESTCNAGDPSSIPAWGRSPGEGKGYQL